MRRLFILTLAVIFAQGCTKSCREDQEAKELTVFFKSPEDESIMVSQVEMAFGVKGMKIRPAMEDINDKESGHFHVLIDNPSGYIEKGKPIPNDDKNIHFDKGESSGSIILPPGTHTLTLQFANSAHLSYGKEMAQTIDITILEYSEEDAGLD